jgi:hypothetical protein
MFAHMIPAPFIDKFTAFLVWLAERIDEIRERNALRAQAALEQAELEQARDDQDAATAAVLGADPAPADPAPAGPDARGGSREPLSAVRRRHRPVILVPGPHAGAARAAACYAGVRSKHVSLPDVIVLARLSAPCGRDKRPVWRGCAGLRLWDGPRIRIRANVVYARPYRYYIVTKIRQRPTSAKGWIGIRRRVWPCRRRGGRNAKSAKDGRPVKPGAAAAERAARRAPRSCAHDRQNDPATRA